MSRLFLLLSIISLFLLACKQKKEETVTPTVSAITEAVFAPGHIEPDDQFSLTAMNDGYINEVLIKEGDVVHHGQILLIQDNVTATIQQQTATENLHIAEEQASSNSAILQQLRAQLSSAGDKLQNDQDQLERMKRLNTTRSVAKIDVDNAQLNYDNSLNNVKSVQQNIEATKITLRQGVVNSRGQQQTAMVNTGYFNIKSPGTYKVYSVLKKRGALVRKGEAVAILGSSSDLKIKLSVDETSIAKVRLGQKVLIEINTEKGTTYTGHISKIYPAFDDSIQAYTVDADFDSATGSIINGSLLQANIIVAKKEKALLIPRSCLTANDKIVIKKDSEADTVSIKTGIISNDWVEVLSGIDMGEKVIKQF